MESRTILQMFRLFRVPGASLGARPAVLYTGFESQEHVRAK
jgi:hypothetical protein